MTPKEPLARQDMPEGMGDCAWTATEGYKYYPPYVNLTGNKLIVRGPETFNGDFYEEGARIEIELPNEALTALAIPSVVQERDELRELLRRLLCRFEGFMPEWSSEDTSVALEAQEASQ